MIYTDNTRKAMKIAYEAHNGQLDKSGVPYIFHPIHLAEQMTTEEECIVALLHDVVEDTDVTFEQLEKEFPDTVIQALKLLTHDDEVAYMDYIRDIKCNRISKNVKLKDLDHNKDITRLGCVTEKDTKRIQKYNEAEKILIE